ncbi:MAG TPA: S8 family serine peptidase [Bdellovibrionales bacterium]|nr:S8 family serine peptidase [Bdellovibrionales bacterium]
MRTLVAALLAVVLTSLNAGAEALIDPALLKFAEQRGSQQRTRIIALLEVPAAAVQLPLKYDTGAVISYLKRISRLAFDGLPRDVQAQQDPDLQIQEFFWINLSFSASVTPAGLMKVAKLYGVKKIYAIHNVNYPTPLPGTGSDIDWPYNAIDTGLDKVVKEAPQIDGRGVLIGHIDTGVDGKHPALSGKIALFFDGQKIAQPTDSAQHGTHTAGTILGGNRESDLIGVAPGAKLISAGFLRGYDEVLRGMQWMLDPDGNPKTQDTPAIVSNSWNAQGAPDLELFYRAISSWEAAGIVTVFSAGNAGPSPKSITAPHEHPDVLAVAATGPDGKVARFSSRGPAVYKGQEIAKPDVSAPGVDINSAIPGGRYGKFSGTSMACPHVAGTAALLLQVNPKLNPAQVREVLRQTTTAVDLDGKPTPKRVWNMAYGLGKLNIYDAVKTAIRLARGGRLDSFFELFKRQSYERPQERFYFETELKGFNERNWSHVTF